MEEIVARDPGMALDPHGAGGGIRTKKARVSLPCDLQRSAARVALAHVVPWLDELRNAA